VVTEFIEKISDRQPGQDVKVMICGCVILRSAGDRDGM